MTSNNYTLADYQDWTKRKAGKLTSIDFIRFIIVGGSGFIINTIILTLLYRVGHLPLVVSQLIGAETALISNFTLHNIWTYKNSLGNSSWLRKLIIFHGSSWSGILITTSILLALVNYLHINYLIGLVVASAITMLWNYTWTRFVIFRSSAKL